jgi:hypothetical protein
MFFDQKFQLTFLWASIKDVQATGEALSTLKREHTPRQNMNFLNFFQFLWVTFALLDPDSESGLYGEGHMTEKRRCWGKEVGLK